MGLFTKKPASGPGATPSSSPPPPPSSSSAPPSAPAAGKAAAESGRSHGPASTSGGPPPPPTHPKAVNVQMTQRPKEAATPKPKQENDEKSKKLHELKGVIHRKLVDQLDMSKLGADATS